MNIVYVLRFYDCDDCDGYHILYIFSNRSDAEKAKKELELRDEKIYGFEVNSYSLKEYIVKQ